MGMLGSSVSTLFSKFFWFFFLILFIHLFILYFIFFFFFFFFLALEQPDKKLRLQIHFSPKYLLWTFQ